MKFWIFIFIFIAVILSIIRLLIMKNLCNVQQKHQRKKFEAGNRKMFTDNNLNIFLFLIFTQFFYANLNTIPADKNVYMAMCKVKVPRHAWDTRWIYLNSSLHTNQGGHFKYSFKTSASDLHRNLRRKGICKRKLAYHTRDIVNIKISTDKFPTDTGLWEDLLKILFSSVSWFFLASRNFYEKLFLDKN